MGWRTDIFSAEPSGGFVCAICHDVLEDATSLSKCGHIFCESCVTSCLQANARASCPTCRAAMKGHVPCYALREIIGSMEVKCPEWKRGGQNQENGPSRKRQRGSNDAGGNVVALAAQASGCDWVGPLKDLKEHEKSCGYKTVTCSVDGCSHSCLRKDMESHLTGGSGILAHMNLMKSSYEKSMKSMEKRLAQCTKDMKKMKSNYDEKIAEMKAEYEEKYNNQRVEGLELAMTHVRYANDCRSWMEYKPDALFDFSIYRIRDQSWKIVGLLCVVPGPKNSAWEGARIPMSLRYISRPRLSPPRCKFPAGFFHANIYPSGTVCVSTLNEDGGWTPETTLSEMLFSCQQLLSHPNFSSPANAVAYNAMAKGSLAEYEVLSKADALKYKSYTGHHPSVAGMLGDGEKVDERDVFEMAESAAGIKKDQEAPTPPPFRRDANGKVMKIPHKRDLVHVENCECSCCAWGQTFWDEKRKMRYLFGY